jgi:hypothetical protein
MPVSACKGRQTRRNIFLLAFFLVVILLVPSCGKGKKSGNDLSVSIKTTSAVFSAEAEIYDASNRMRLPMVISGGHAMAEFKEIPTGEWQIVIRLRDAKGKLLYLGTGSANIRGQETATEEIKLVKSLETGSLRVVAAVPEQPVETMEVPVPVTVTNRENTNQGHLLLWNTFDSEQDVTNSKKGPTGEISGTLDFLSSGTAKTVKPGSPDARINFQGQTIFNPGAGCIELWVIPQESGTQQKSAYYYFDSYDPGTRLGFRCGMDDKKGVFFILFHNGQAHIGKDDSMTAVQINQKKPESFKTGDRVHISLVWDLRGVNGSRHSSELFINGKLNNWDDSKLVGPLGTGAITVLNSRPGSKDLGCRDALDDIKIWDFAKTDFGLGTEGQ